MRAYFVGERSVQGVSLAAAYGIYAAVWLFRTALLLVAWAAGVYLGFIVIAWVVALFSGSKPHTKFPSAKEQSVVAESLPAERSELGEYSRSGADLDFPRNESLGYQTHVTSEQAAAIYQGTRDWSLNQTKVYVRGYERGATHVNGYYRNQPGRPTAIDNAEATLTGLAAVGLGVALDYGSQRLERWWEERQARKQADARPGNIDRR